MWHYTAPPHFHGLVLGWAWGLYRISVVIEMACDATRCHLNGFVCNLCPSFLKSQETGVLLIIYVFVLHRVKWQAVTCVEHYWEMEM